ncbi:MAG: DUF3189 family protein [Syntrophomonas sp.]|nr:DUF3189 family protein [Syntrophomonas sp.]
MVYFDYGGSHTSVTAACIHVGKLDPNKLPNSDDLMEMPYLDKITPKDFGKIKHIGTDKNENEIYALGTKGSQLGNLLDDMASSQGISDQYLFLCTSPYVNNVLRVGGWWSPVLKMVKKQNAESFTLSFRVWQKSSDGKEHRYKG